MVDKIDIIVSNVNSVTMLGYQMQMTQLVQHLLHINLCFMIELTDTLNKDCATNHLKCNSHVISFARIVTRALVTDVCSYVVFQLFVLLSLFLQFFLFLF